MPIRGLLRAVGAPLLLGAVVTASVPGVVLYRIKPGDTLSEIATRYHTTVQRLVALNHLPGNGDLIYAGAVLKIPSQQRATPRRTSTSYVVRPGDTASAIARHYHTDLRWLRTHNDLGPTYLIIVGERLTVPVAVRVRHVPNSFAGRTYPTAVTQSAARHRAYLARHPGPSREHVRRLVVRAAHRYDVEPALALAVAEQESGYQQRVVSPADAIGAMQVIPPTGDFVSRFVVHRRLNLLRATDNVTAGVALLGQLTSAAHLRGAVAGYYQGLGSVRRNGMYKDTKRYVRNVLALRDRLR